VAAADDYRYAAGLYRALEGSLSSRERGPGRLSPDAAELLLRALFGQGREEQTLPYLSGREDLARDLLLLGGLEDDRGWGDLELERWRSLFDGEDGESLYWRARLELTRGESEEARRRLKRLLRREAGSVFAPAALELLEGIPVVEAPAPVQAREEAAASGVRVQWGVFRDPLRARRQREAVEAYGQAAELLSFRRDGIELYRVCSPPFTLDESAREAGELLESRYGLEYVLHRPDATPEP